MRISGFYPTYVYNTNYVSAKSLGKVEAIPDDALKGKTNYADSGRNTNPLRPGTSKDFAGIVASQMAMGRMRAARIMKQPSEISAVQGGAEQEQALRSQTIQDRQPAENGGMNAIQMNMAMLGA